MAAAFCVLCMLLRWAAAGAELNCRDGGSLPQEIHRGDCRALVGPPGIRRSGEVVEDRSVLNVTVAGTLRLTRVRLYVLGHMVLKCNSDGEGGKVLLENGSSLVNRGKVSVTSCGQAGGPIKVMSLPEGNEARITNFGVFELIDSVRREEPATTVQMHGISFYNDGSLVIENCRVDWLNVLTGIKQTSAIAKTELRDSRINCDCAWADSCISIEQGVLIASGNVKVFDHRDSQQPAIKNNGTLLLQETDNTTLMMDHGKLRQEIHGVLNITLHSTKIHFTNSYDFETPSQTPYSDLLGTMYIRWPLGTKFAGIESVCKEWAPSCKRDGENGVFFQIFEFRSTVDDIYWPKIKNIADKLQPLSVLPADVMGRKWGLLFEEEGSVSHSLTLEIGGCRPGTRKEGVNCRACPKGKYSGNEDAENCKECDIGKFQNVEGATQCDDCAQGWYSAAGQDACVACGPGTYANEETRQCETCEKGKFQDKEGATFCTPCASGTFTKDRGFSLCKECEAGKYQELMGKTFCQNCSAGNFSEKAATLCSPCPSGSFTSLPGMPRCTLCDEGKSTTRLHDDSPNKSSNHSNSSNQGHSMTVDATGAVRCEACAPGTFAASRGAKSCAKCARNTFSSVASSTVCLNCPLSTYQPFAGQAMCNNCPNVTNPSMKNVGDDQLVASKQEGAGKFLEKHYCSVTNATLLAHDLEGEREEEKRGQSFIWLIFVAAGLLAVCCLRQIFIHHRKKKRRRQRDGRYTDFALTNIPQHVHVSQGGYNETLSRLLQSQQQAKPEVLPTSIEPLNQALPNSATDPSTLTLEPSSEPPLLQATFPAKSGNADTFESVDQDKSADSVSLAARVVLQPRAGVAVQHVAEPAQSPQTLPQSCPEKMPVFSYPHHCTSSPATFENEREDAKRFKYLMRGGVPRYAVTSRESLGKSFSVLSAACSLLAHNRLCAPLMYLRDRAKAHAHTYHALRKDVMLFERAGAAAQTSEFASVSAQQPKARHGRFFSPS